MKVELLKEPFLEFGNDFISDDPKLGISAGSFFSVSNNTHRSELHYAIIGTNNNIEAVKKWIDKFENPIEATSEEIDIVKEAGIIDGEVLDNIMEIEDDGSLFHLLAKQAEEEIKKEIREDISLGEESESYIVVNKRLNPDFPGFNEEHPFYCRFVNDEANNKTIKEAQIKEIMEDEELQAFDKLVRICDLYIAAYKLLISKSVSKPEVCILTIPTKVFKRFASLPFKGSRFFNLRRYLKAQLITLPNAIPVQIILEDTFLGTRRSLQDLSMQAWNFCVANYYKNTGTPWTLSLKDKNSCFIGISFHKVLSSDSNVMRSSVAQAFNYEGKGIIFVGDQFEWDSKKTNTPAPHLNYEYAKNLIANVIQEYKLYNKNLAPTRIVIHKTTDFWDSKINSDYAEVEGLKDGIRSVLGNDVEIDLVAIKSANIKLLRKQGNYPVIRGTLLHVDEATGVLYTTGYIPYYETFPSSHIPHPLEINIYEAESTLKKISGEILALTKMNFNNCNYYNSLPITIQFAQKVGEIIQYMEEGTTPPNKYFFYM
jgi:hypothetical protein